MKEETSVAWRTDTLQRKKRLKRISKESLKTQQRSHYKGNQARCAGQTTHRHRRIWLIHNRWFGSGCSSLSISPSFPCIRMSRRTIVDIFVILISWASTRWTLWGGFGRRRGIYDSWARTPVIPCTPGCWANHRVIKILILVRGVVRGSFRIKRGLGEVPPNSAHTRSLILLHPVNKIFRY